MAKDIWITGIGACTAFAADAERLWWRASGLGCATASRETQSIDKTAETAVREALKDARLFHNDTLQNVSSDRVGCSFSVSKPILNLSSPAVTGRGSKLFVNVDSPPEAAGNDDFINPPEVISQHIANRFHIHGERRNVIAACATGAYSVALGASWIRDGLCDVVIAGSGEPPCNPLMRAGFQKMGVLTEDSAMRPFDRRRSGFVLGDGAGAVILESSEQAARRNARPRARLSGWGWGADSHSAVAFNSNGERIASVIRQALSRAGLQAPAIEHVNAHGTATSLNDWIETQALLKAFGRHAENLKISATKSTTGHLLGAAGSIELVLTVQALERGFIPPTATLEEADPECPLNYTPRTGQAAKFGNALSLSFGFGGPIGALIVSRN
jgi:3-oxoacyl-(acyl-carrier-protein) synthase